MMRMSVIDGRSCSKKDRFPLQFGNHNVDSRDQTDGNSVVHGHAIRQFHSFVGHFGDRGTRRTLWYKGADMTVLVTGGAGYIGSHMVLALAEAGEKRRRDRQPVHRILVGAAGGRAAVHRRRRRRKSRRERHRPARRRKHHSFCRFRGGAGVRCAIRSPTIATTP